MQSQTKKLLLSCLVALAAFGSSAHAALVKWTMSGEITAVDNRAGLLPFPDVAIGDRYSLLFSFDSRSPDGLPDSETQGWYHDAITAMSITINGFTQVVPPGDQSAGNDIYIYNDEPLQR